MSGKKEISYNDAIREVEAILAKLNNDSLDVDQLSAHVARAVELIGLCREKLRRAEEDVARTLEESECETK